MGLGVINELDYNILIFHCVDALNTYDSSNEFYNKFKRIVKKSDIVLTPSKLLEKDLKKLIIELNEFLMAVMTDI